jgi:hypothetical protein
LETIADYSKVLLCRSLPAIASGGAARCCLNLLDYLLVDAGECCQSLHCGILPSIAKMTAVLRHIIQIIEVIKINIKAIIRAAAAVLIAGGES